MLCISERALVQWVGAATKTYVATKGTPQKSTSNKTHSLFDFAVDLTEFFAEGVEQHLMPLDSPAVLVEPHHLGTREHARRLLCSRVGLEPPRASRLRRNEAQRENCGYTTS